MTISDKKQKIEYGDWQTPRELAQRICQKLAQLGVQPDIIIEPTCGIGNFLWASTQQFPATKQFFGFEHNPNYVTELNKQAWVKDDNMQIAQADFFDYNWGDFIKNLTGNLLVIGNFPWVTNSQQGMIGGGNLPQKSNMNRLSGISALTGNSNFDISEWMLRETVQWFLNRNGTLAMLCKTSVARKFLAYLQSTNQPLKEAMLFKIDSKRHFGASVEACLLYCDFDTNSHNYDYTIFDNLDATNGQSVGYRDGILVSNITLFKTYRYLNGKNSMAWRSGIKHDCASVMELIKTPDGYRNGFGEIISLEEEWVYPLLKGSDIANGHTQTPKHYILLPQKHHQDSTKQLQLSAPKIWAYLEQYSNYFENRKSRIYQHKDRFSIFGIGDYSFKPYKIAIAGLYKTLRFELIGHLENKPIMVDDTVYFLGFDNEQDAKNVFSFLQSEPVQQFLTSLIFWDDKRPIKANILNCLKIELGLNFPTQLSLF